LGLYHFLRKTFPGVAKIFRSRNSFVAQLDESQGITTQSETNRKPLSDTAFPTLWRMLQAANGRKITTPRRPETFLGTTRRSLPRVEDSSSRLNPD